MPWSGFSARSVISPQPADLANTPGKDSNVTEGLRSGDSAKTASAEDTFVADLLLANNDIGVVGSA